MSRSPTEGPRQPTSRAATLDSNDPEDSISVTSTIPDPNDREYEVEDIIYEELSDQGDMRYLVKWTGYDDMENTFEPASSFVDPSTLDEWRRKRYTIRDGQEAAFDIGEWKRRKEAFELAKATAKQERHARRKAKRRRLGIQVSPSLSEEESADAMDVDDTDVITGLPLTRSRRRTPRDSDLESFISEDDEPLFKVSERQKNDRRGRLSRDASFSSTDSLMEDLKARATGRDQENLAEGMQKAPSMYEKRDSLSKKAGLLKMPIQDPAKKHGSKNPSVEPPKKPVQTPKKAAASIPASTVTTATRLTKLADNTPAKKAPRPSLAPLRAVLSGAGMSGAIASPGRPSTSMAAKSQLGPGKFARRTGNSLLQEKAKKNVLQNWGAKPKPRKTTKPAVDRSPSSDARLYKTLQWRRRAELRGRREPEPDMNALDLRTPSEFFEPSTSDHPALSGGGSRTGLEQSHDEAMSQDGGWKEATSDLSVPSQRDPWMKPQLHDEGRRGAMSEYPVPSRRGSRTGADFSERGDVPFFYAEQAPVPRPAFDPKRLLSATKHYFNPGELLVTMQVLEMELGDVRLCGLRPIARRPVYRLKDNHRINLHFANVFSLGEYRNLVQGRSDPTFTNGWIEGFDDTRDGCNQLGDLLRNANSAAVWNHPYEDLALIIYHQMSVVWEFFDDATDEPYRSSLRIAARSRLPSLPRFEGSVGAFTISPRAPPPPLPPPPPPPLDAAITPESDEVIATSPEPRLQLSTNAMAGLNVTDLQALFHDQFKIDFKRLMELHGERVAQKVCLIFPPGTEAECQLFEHFLTPHGVDVFSNKCSTNNIRDVWAKFRVGEDVGAAGCVLIHEKFSYIDRLPDLARMLTKFYVFWCVSLEKTIPWDIKDRNLVRLFPHGGCILLTEDLLANYTHKALQIVKWFRSYARGKPPGNWKLVLRPQIREWLMCKAEETKDLRFLQIRLHITALISGHPNEFKEIEEFDGRPDDIGQHYPVVSLRSIPKYGFRQEDDHPKVPKGLTQEERNNDHLMEWFAGWCICYNSENYRKFIVVYGKPPHEHTKQWHGITFRTPEEFAAQYQLNLGPDPGPQATLPQEYFDEYERVNPFFVENLKELARAGTS